MEKTIIACLAGAMILGGAVAATAGGPFVDRERRQQARIHQGIQRGAITPGEYRALQHEQAAIERYRHHAWADGNLSPGEAVRLHHMQDRAGRHIYRAKHNGRFR